MSKMDEFKALSIIFHDDAETWAETFVNNFQAIHVGCSVLNIKTLLPIPQIKDRDQLKASKAILVILSEQLLDFLVKSKGLHLRDCICDPQKGVLFYLNVAENDITEHHLEDRFAEYHSPLWTKQSYDENSNADNFQDCLNTVHQIVINNSEDTNPAATGDAEQLADINDVDGIQPGYECNPSEPQGSQSNLAGKDSSRYMQMDKSPKTQFYTDEEYTVTDRPQVTLNQDCYADVPQQDGTEDSYEVKQHQPEERKTANKQFEFSAVPDVIPCERDTEVALCFKETLDGYEADSMDLELIDKEDSNSKFAVKEVEQLNPYTYKFKLNGNQTERKVNIHVYWKDECVGSCHVEFRAYTPVIDGISNILLQVLDETCGLLQQTDADGLQKLDNQLKKTFLSDTTTIRPDAFENIFGMYEFIDHDIDSKEEIPTLVHLAAKYGLKEMSAKLMDLPSACKACSITNKEHKQPAELAEKHHQFELASFFRNISDIGEDLYGYYVKMESYDLGYLKAKQKHYYNNRAKDSDRAMALYYIYNKVTTLPVSPHAQPPDHLVYDETEFLPTEDYMDMNTVKRERKLNPPPRRQGVPVARQKPPAPDPSPKPNVSAEGEIYDDANQGPQNPRFTFSMTPAEKEAANEASIMSPIMSPEQLELVKIQKQVVEDELSINEARDLYFEWKRLHEEKPNDFKSKNAQMQKVHNLLETKKKGNKKSKPCTGAKPITLVKPTKGQEKKAKQQIKLSSDTKVYVRAGNIQRPPASPKPTLKLPAPEEVYDDVVDSDTDDKKPRVPVKNFRNSSGSNGSRDSQTSTGDSGVGLDGEDDKAPKRPGPRKNAQRANSRKSFTEVHQLPPKLPARGTHLRAAYGKPLPETPTSPESPPFVPRRWQNP